MLLYNEHRMKIN